MKKCLSVVGMITGAMLVSLEFALKIKKPVAVTRINSADGPTSIFLTGKIGSGSSSIFLTAGIIFMIASAAALVTGKK